MLEIEVAKPVSYKLVSRQEQVEELSFVVVCCWILLDWKVHLGVLAVDPSTPPRRVVRG